LLSAVILAALAVPLARAEETCGDLLTDAAIDQALDQIKKESPWASLSGLNTGKTIADAYLNAPEGKKAEAVAKAMAEAGVTLTVAGSAVLILTGKIYVKGVEWTIAAMEEAQTNAFLCGDVSSGSGFRVRGPFEMEGAQAISPRITCQNFPDFLDTPARFEAFRAFFKGYYTRTMGEMGLGASLLDRQWAVIERQWQAREAERQLQKLARAIARKLAEEERKAKEAARPCPPPPPVLGADTSDPAKQPEPPASHLPMLVLVETVVSPHSLDPSISHTAAPQRNTISAYWGESTCSWSAPPKSLVTEEVFGFDFQLSAESKNQQRYTEGLVVRSGFSNVNSLPNEIYVSVEPGQGKSAQGHLELGVGDLTFGEDYVSWYLTVGGCGGNVDYIYRLRKP
jgi:hypothetical protein